MYRKLFTFLFFLLLSFNFFLYPASARTTPADIISSQREVYNQRLKTYSSQSQNKLTDYDKKIADLNKKITQELEANLLRQGQVLEEYSRRQNLDLSMGGKDGISRNLQNPTENAQYWLNFAHEAAAYQAAQVYIINLTGEANINRDINSQVSSLEGDINILRGKVLKSQKIIAELVNK